MYEVEHTKLGTHYALKTFVLENDEFAELFQNRFLAEGPILARLQHPNIVRVFDLNVDPDTRVVYYVMNLVLCKDGEAHSLADFEQGGAEEEHVVAWFKQLCDALAYVHGNGIVHRDIKPANILIAPERHVVISDFGISKVRNEELRVDIHGRQHRSCRFFISKAPCLAGAEVALMCMKEYNDSVCGTACSCACLAGYCEER